MFWRRAEESNPHPVFPGALVFGTRKRCRRFAPSDGVRAGTRTSTARHLHLAHPRGIELRIAVLEAATVAVRSGVWYSRQESNLQYLTLVLSELRLPVPPREHNWWAGGDSNSHCTRRLVLSEVCLRRPVSRAGLEPAKLQLSTAGVCRLRHLDILVRAAGLEPA
jgi:hypothetical protein